MAFNQSGQRCLSPRRKRLKKNVWSWRTVLVSLVTMCFLLKLSIRSKELPAGLSKTYHEGNQLQLSLENPPKTPCHVLVISTFPPRKCGIAQFTQLFLNATQQMQDDFPAEWECHYSVLALDDTDDMTGYDPELVVGKIVKDTVQPGLSFWNASRWILEHQITTTKLLQRTRAEGLSLVGLPKHSVPFTHMLMELEFGIVWHKWQLLDLVRWVVAGQRELQLEIGDLQSVLVCHSPFAYPHIEEKGFVRHLVDHSSAIVAMSWHGYHSLVTAYGVPESKVFFIPHGLSLPTGLQRARRLKPAPAVSPDEAPDLETLEHLMSLPAGHIDRPLLVMSHGLIHKNKGYHRIVRNLREIVEGVEGKQRVALLILGMEHSKNVDDHIMPALLEEAAALGVRPYITWHSEYSSQTDISKWLELSDVYASMYEEIAPTSGALLQAMAHGCPIVATSYRFANEVLTDQRGLTVPFEDDSKIQSAFISLLNSPTLRQRLGRSAAQFARHWTWDQVAVQYRVLLAATQWKHQNRTQLPREYFIRPVVKPPGLRPLTTDPFGPSYHLDSDLYPVQKRNGVKPSQRNQEFVAHWSADSVVAFHGVEMYSKAKHGEVVLEEQRLSRGVYGIYADRELQVNGVVERPHSYALSKVALRWRDVRILVDSEKGVQIEGELTGVENEILEGQGGYRLDEYTKPVTLFRSAGRRLLSSADTEIEFAGSEESVVQGRREPGQDEWKRLLKLENMPLGTYSRGSGLPDNDEIKKVADEENRRIAALRNLSSRFHDFVRDKDSALESGQLGRRQLDLADGSFYNKLVLKTGQVTIVVTVKVGKEVTVSLQDPSRFDHPHGLLGQTVRCAWDLPARTTGICPATFRKELNIGGDMASLNPDVWLVAGSKDLDNLGRDLYSTRIPGQEWRIWGVYFNELEEDQLWLTGVDFDYKPR